MMFKNKNYILKRLSWDITTKFVKIQSDPYSDIRFVKFILINDSKTHNERNALSSEW